MKLIKTLLLSLIFSNALLAQQPNFKQLWSEVETLELEDLPKSALEKVEIIDKIAIENNNQPQHIKSMLYKSKFAMVLEEDAQLNIIINFKSEILKSKSPTKNILESILADLYWAYFKQHRYQFYNRTKTETKQNETDFRTWDLATIFNEIQFHFQNSLSNEAVLKQTPIEEYSTLIRAQKDSQIYRPTLYDLLAHNALEFYKSSERSISKPAYTFEIDDDNLLRSATAYSKLSLQTKDTISLEFQALKIYQNLIQFHLKDKDLNPLVTVDIERLLFVKEKAMFKNSEELLINTLKSSAEVYKTNPVSGYYNLEIANIWYNEGARYKSGKNKEYRWKSKDALALCEAVISKFPKSKPSDACKQLKSEIVHPEVSIKTELMLPIQTQSRFLITYKNASQLEFKAFKVSHKELLTFNSLYKKKEIDSFVSTLKINKTWTSGLKNEGDYQEHTSEIIAPEFENGLYIISATDSDSNTSGLTTLQVTNIASIEKDDDRNNRFQFIDRNTGKPFTNTEVTINYTYNNNKKKTETKRTDSYGNIAIPKTTNRVYARFDLVIKTTEDTAYFDNYRLDHYYEFNPNDNKTKYNAFLFTDRSIYRPGQIVYFKAISMQTKANKSAVLKNETVTVTLFNINHEDLKKQTLKTNDFGSVNGAFTLPTNGLNGEYHLEFKSESEHFKSSLYFSVEDYKRPTFAAQFDPITETYTVNDSVSVIGKATAFNGSKITNAKVVYRVKRIVDFPNWYYRTQPYFYSEPQEITHGETVTDDAGNFNINFKAIPDHSLDNQFLPVFRYEVTADITDINGETRTASTTLSVGYHTLLASLQIENKLDKTSKTNQITINTTNLNGEFTPVTGTLKIYKLQAPNQVLRERPWNAPDYQIIKKETFNMLFPHDAYTNEDKLENWKKGKLVLDKTINTGKTTTVNLEKTKRWESGQYIAIFESKAKYNQSIKDEVNFELYSADDKTVPDHGLFQITTNTLEYTPGEFVVLTLSSAAQDLVATVEVEKNHTIYSTHIITLNQNKKTIKIPVFASDLGGFAMHYSYAAFNSFKSGTTLINVPYPNTDLQIEVETFRDKIQPGEEETWRFKISGAQGEKVAAEILASMYDASLDQFKPHKWNLGNLNPPPYYSYNNWNSNTSFGTNYFNIDFNYGYHSTSSQQFDALNWFGFSFNANSWTNRQYLTRKKSSSEPMVAGEIMETVLDKTTIEDIPVTSQIRGASATENDGKEPLYIIDGVVSKTNNVTKEDILHIEILKGNEATALYGSKGAHGVIVITTKKGSSFNDVKIRKNLQETAFFFPNLQTDHEGNVSFSFTSPEALTQWKLQFLAHTQTMESALKTLTTVTQKELMVQPNVPRFLRQGDKITISSKIVNLSDKPLEGQAVLQLFDAVTNTAIDINLDNINAVKPFSVDANTNTQVSWQLKIPETIDIVQYKIIAKAGNFSDGEQNVIPVLSNRMLVTETLPMWVNGDETRSFTLDKLKDNTSTTLKNHKLTLEITSNPAWYAIQALPYIIEYPFDCNEQIFSRFYGNSLARHIVNSNPRIQEVFNIWKSKDALMSNLEQNEELKSILIEETPWLRDAESETEQKKRIGLLFDMNTMSAKKQATQQKLERNQLASGAWPWFAGGLENRYITQHIVTGFGHLQHLGIDTIASKNMLSKALKFTNSEFIETYKDISKHEANPDYDAYHLNSIQLHYLYMRSFYSEDKPTEELQNIINYYGSQIKTYWTKGTLYEKGLMALIAQRSGDTKTASAIIKSLKENSITSEELGMYWKANTASWYWYESPIETQSLLIEAFSEIENNTITVDNLTKWLLKNKQTNRWSTTKSTTDAIYAILLKGSDWLSVSESLDITVGGKPIPEDKLKDTQVEAGTGYFKTTWSADEITPHLAEITLTNKNAGIAWGSLYWQYFEDLDAITSAKTPLQLTKKLFLKSNTDTGEELTEITTETDLKVGDLIRVRIVLKTDRDMEFLHMKDMRASGLEPIDVISKYKRQDGLGYYQSTKDAATHFFFDRITKGIYVFEYDLRVNNAGQLSNGITTIQSMYAPEFSSHSEGTTITIE